MMYGIAFFAEHDSDVNLSDHWEALNSEIK